MNARLLHQSMNSDNIQYHLQRAHKEMPLNKIKINLKASLKSILTKNKIK